MMALKMLGTFSVPNIKSFAETLATALAHVMKLAITDREFYREILQRTLVSAPYIHSLWVFMEGADKRKGSPYLHCWKSADGIQFEVFQGDHLQQIEKLCSTVKREQLTLTTGPSRSYLGNSVTLAATAVAPIHLDGVYSGIAAAMVSLDQLAEEAMPQADQAMNHWISSLETDLGCGLILFDDDGKALAHGNQGRSHLRNLNEKKKTRSLIRQYAMPQLKRTWVMMEPAAAATQKAPTRAGVSHREYQLLPLLALGKSNDEIASSLSISSNTVKNHLDKIFKKIGVSNRHAAAVWWQQRQASGLFNS